MSERPKGASDAHWARLGTKAYIKIDGRTISVQGKEGGVEGTEPFSGGGGVSLNAQQHVERKNGGLNPVLRTW